VFAQPAGHQHSHRDEHRHAAHENGV
jgi:hypothetical protein